MLMMVKYSVKIESPHIDELAIPIVFCGFRKSLLAIAYILLQLGCDHSLANTIRFISH
jgi:hypothetical protein